MKIDIKDAQGQALQEVQQENFNLVKEKIKKKYIELASAEKIVENIKKEIEEILIDCEAGG